MAHKLGNRIKETASTTGTGSFTLAGAVAGFATFASKLTADGDTTWYCAVNGSEWEVGLGTRTSATVLARTTIYASSNSGSAVSFTVAPTIFCDMPAEKLDPGPAFSVYRATSNQNVTSATLTKVQLNAEEYDLGSCFDSTTNYRFTPNVPGYYQFSWCVRCDSATSSIVDAAAILYKNGAAIKTPEYVGPAVASIGVAASALVYMNGTTDYAEIYTYITGTSPRAAYGSNITFFSGYLARPD